MQSPFKFQSAARPASELSELLPHTAEIADEITLVRSMMTDSVDHESRLRIIHSGKISGGPAHVGLVGRLWPGHGTQDLPAYVVLSDPGGLPVDGIRNWSFGLAAGDLSGHADSLVQARPFSTCPRRRTPGSARGRINFELSEKLNRAHLQRHPENSELRGAHRAITKSRRGCKRPSPRCSTFPAKREATRKLYGLDHPHTATANYAKRCLMARRLVEQGRAVRADLS